MAHSRKLISFRRFDIAIFETSIKLFLQKSGRINLHLCELNTRVCDFKPLDILITSIVLLIWKTHLKLMITL